MWTYNSVHDILKFLKVKLHDPFTTSKMELDIQCKKLYAHVVSEVIKQLKILGNKQISGKF